MYTLNPIPPPVMRAHYQREYVYRMQDESLFIVQASEMVEYCAMRSDPVNTCKLALRLLEHLCYKPAAVYEARPLCLDHRSTHHICPSHTSAHHSRPYHTFPLHSTQLSSYSPL